MKQMKGLSPLGMAGLGLAALAARLCLYRLAVDSRGLLTGHWLSWLLAVLTAGAVVLALKLCRSFTPEPSDRPNYPAAVGHWLFAVGLLLPGAMDVSGALPALKLAEPVFRFAAVLALAAAGFSRLQGRRVFFGCYGLVCLYLAVRCVIFYGLWSHEPQLMDYVFALLANICLTLFAYRSAAETVGLGGSRSRLFFGMLGSFCALAASVHTECPAFFIPAAVWLTVCVLFDTPGEKEEAYGNPQ